MKDIHRQLYSLNTYVRGSITLQIDRLTPGFAATFRAAEAKCKELGLKSPFGIELTWSSTAPEHVLVYNDSFMPGKQTYLTHLFVEGPLAEALLADLQRQAQQRAVEDIRRERDEALQREAEERVRQLLSKNVGPASAPAPVAEPGDSFERPVTA